MNYGANIGVQIELWSISDEEIVLPVENSLTRRTVLPRRSGPRNRRAIRPDLADHREHVRRSCLRYQLRYRSCLFLGRRLFQRVSGSARQADAELHRRRGGRIRGRVSVRSTSSSTRYGPSTCTRRGSDGSSSQPISDRPDWLADDPRVTFMPSEKFFADPSVLPTHNSQAVECQLHHIPGLAEHFLYSNDRHVLRSPRRPDMFFSPGGISMFIEADTRIGLGHNDNDRSGFENAARVNRRLLQDRFGLDDHQTSGARSDATTQERDGRDGTRVRRRTSRPLQQAPSARVPISR